MRLGFALAILLCPLDLAGQRATGAEADSTLQASIARIRAATETYHDLGAARAAAYHPSEPDPCMASAAGGMGHHLMNMTLFDDRLDVERPEILVYAPLNDGGRKLTGVEYVVPYSAWDREEAPRILGQDLKRSDGLAIWYLHVWVWEKNPNGIFADWNPAVTCSA
jgi:hypothetical protein